jgi:hypothetical protein
MSSTTDSPSRWDDDLPDEHPTIAQQPPLILTRDEAVEVAGEMAFTGNAYYSIDRTASREKTDKLIRRLQLEAAVRDAGGWWGDDDPYARATKGAAPATFELASSGLSAFAELLPELRKGVACVLSDCENRSYAEEEEADGVREELRLLDAIRDRLDAEAVTA